MEIALSLAYIPDSSVHFHLETWNPIKLARPTFYFARNNYFWMTH